MSPTPCAPDVFHASCLLHFQKRAALLGGLMRQLAEADVVKRVAAGQRLAVKHRLRMLADKALVDVPDARVVGRELLEGAFAVVKQQVHLVGLAGMTGELEERAIAAQRRLVAVDLEAEIAERAGEAAAQFGKRRLDGELRAVGEERLDVRAVLSRDAHGLGQIHRGKLDDFAFQDVFSRVEAVAGHIPDRTAHLCDVAAAPGGGFGRIIAVCELHVEAGVVHLAELPGLHRRLGELIPRIEDHHVVHKERKALRLCRIDQLSGIRRTGRQRFLDDDVLAGLQRLQGQRDMRAVVGGHVNRLDFRSAQQFLGGRVPLQTQRLGGALTRGVHIRRGNQFRRGMRGEPRAVAGEALLCDAILGDAAKADQTVFHCRHNHCLLVGLK